MNLSDLFTEQEFTEKNIVILGLARQGKALARFFVHAGANVTISDMAAPDQLTTEQDTLAGLPIRYVLGEHPLSLLEGCDLLCLSGGVPPQLPLVREAIARGIPLSNDGLLTFQVAQRLGLGPLLAVTGSSGKTTTTTLIGRMLEAAGHQTHVGGNIGTPLLDRLDAVYPQMPIVLELSSFQLELFTADVAYGNLQGIGPQIAALLNITPNHLDRHPTMAAYAAAKFNLIRVMPHRGKLVLSLDDPVTAQLIPDAVLAELPGSRALARPKVPREWQLDSVLEQARGWIREQELQIIPFSRRHALNKGAWLANDTLLRDGVEICTRTEVLLPGDHNISNLLAAMAAAGEMLAASNPPHMARIHAVDTAEPPAAPHQLSAVLRTVAQRFTGVAHRLEIVASSDEITWINDSIATSPERAIAGLRALDAPEKTIILLAGGKDKNLAWDEFAAEIVERVDFLIGFGQSGPMLVELVQDRARYRQKKAPNCAVVQRLEEAVSLARRTAHNKTIVLLSPGGTSYDMYKDFEARGNHFRKLAQQQTAAGAQIPISSRL